MGEDISALKKRIEELEEMQRLAQSLSSVVGVYDTIEAVAESCLKLCQAERSAILLIGAANEDPARTVVRSTAGMKHEIDHRVNSMILAWIERNKKPLLTNDVLATLNIKSPAPGAQQLGPALAVPLVAEDKIIGVMNLVNSRGGVPFSEDSMRIATHLAPLATRFIERSKFQESLFESNARLNAALHQQYDTSAIVGKSRAVEDIAKKIPIMASSASNILITGETGSGKGLVAKVIHFTGPRAEKPFVSLNCAAVSPDRFDAELFGDEQSDSAGGAEGNRGKIELARGGTLFLDEIAAMPLELQPRLLRVLEERSSSGPAQSAAVPASARVVAASDKDLLEAVRAGKFVEDLYHLLNVIPVYLPPLRDRTEDIPLLARKFLLDFSGEAKHFRPDALEMLSKMEWKGNVRELRNAVERISMFATSPEISALDLRQHGVSQTERPSANA
jgi:Nif-specific regulatory protein